MFFTQDDYIKNSTICNSSNRPSDVSIDKCIFDAKLNKPIWWTGTKWVDATGADV